MDMSDFHVDIGPQYEGETVRKEDMYVEFGGPKAHQDIVGQTVSFTPYVTGGNVVAWRCGNAGIPGGGALMNGGDDHIAPTIDLRYLPTSCR